MCELPVEQNQLGPACLDGLRALDDLRPGLVIAAGLGAPLPGSASNLGRRFGKTPRVAVGGRIGIARFDVRDPDAWGTGDASSSWVPVFSGSIGIGAFDGFSLAPTVSGLLSIDLLGDVATTRLPSDRGFDGASTTFGFGARIGLLNESFTLPGASISVMRRTGASATLEGEVGSLEADMSVTSIRATVGKDVLGFGVFGGMGWERHSADAQFLIADDVAPLSFRTDTGTKTDKLLFGGVTRTFLVTQFGLEFGFSDEVAFGSLSLRLTI